ncbi:TPA: hypothetical protein QFC76_000654 [Enterococcus faecium]
MKKAKLILSTIVLTSLSSGFLGSGTVDASAYNQSDSTQRWVMEYNANAGGYYIREQIPGGMNSSPNYIWRDSRGGGFVDFSSNRENVGTLWKLHSAGQNSLGNIFFIENMSSGTYLNWSRGGHTDLGVFSTAFDWNREQRFIVQVEGEV